MPVHRNVESSCPPTWQTFHLISVPPPFDAPPYVTTLLEASGQLSVCQGGMYELKAMGGAVKKAGKWR